MNAYLATLFLYPRLARLEWLRSGLCREYLRRARALGLVSGWELTDEGYQRLADMGIIAF